VRYPGGIVVLMSPCSNCIGCADSRNGGIVSSSASLSFQMWPRRFNCRAYHSIPRYGVRVTVTSGRTPSTSWAYHSGKLSLSPFVISTAFGSTELSRSDAHSRVNDCPRREAAFQFPSSGISATAMTATARFRHTHTTPRAASSPHRENVHM